jgi:hypothetical protein
MRRMPRVSVLMPVHAQAAFLPRAMRSLIAQDLDDWEVIVVDDGSPDDVAGALAPFVADPRLRLVRLGANGGLGAALNHGLDASSAELVGYLPADDLLHSNHLSALVALMDDDVALAHTRCSPSDPCLQLVQLMHRRTPERWLERSELESDDLEPLLLGRLRAAGRVAAGSSITCDWTQHPGQRHRTIRQSRDGGVNAFRARYRVARPLRLHSSEGGMVDEVARYARFRDRARASRAPDGLRILLAGELAFNPERVLALEERGHELLGLWIDHPLGFNSVGPLPFGRIPDLAGIADIPAARPDVIYALLNWRSVSLAHAILDARTGVPLVFHFKEAPQRSIARGEWPLLADVVTRADAVLFSSPEERAWFQAALPGRLDPDRTLVLDGDLPKRDWLDAAPAEPFSAVDGQPHTVLLGRPYGFDDALLTGLADRGVEVHVHAARTAVEPADWVSTLSRYDAGWLHPVRAHNGGEIARATWDDLNLPARIPTLAAAGLALILPRNGAGELHAGQALAESLGIAVAYDDLDDLGAQLRDRAAMGRRRARAFERREELTFDFHADRLVELLRAVAWD